MSTTTAEAGRRGAAADRERFYAEVDARWPDLDPKTRDEFATELYRRALAARGRLGGIMNRKPKKTT